MAMLEMTHVTLSRDLGRKVPEMYVVIAKNSILEMDTTQIAGLLGATEDEIREVEADQEYKDVRLILAAEHARSRVDADLSWDSLEEMALKNLHKRVVFEQDSEFLLKVAAVANKAQRRMTTNQPKVLDPAGAGARVPLTLTTRIVQRLNRKTGEETVEETRQISLTDGSAKNPTFDDIDALLGVSQRPKIQEKMAIRTHPAEFSVDDLAIEYLNRAKG